MSDQKLKQCPFCDGNATMYKGRYSEDGKRDEPWAVSCDRCDARVYLMPEYGEGNYWWKHTAEGEEHMREAIISKWNTRSI